MIDLPMPPRVCKVLAANDFKAHREMPAFLRAVNTIWRATGKRVDVHEAMALAATYKPVLPMPPRALPMPPRPLPMPPGATP